MRDRQIACVAFIRRFQRASGGVSPTYRQIATELGLPSTSTTQRLLAELEAKGWIERKHNRHRAIEVKRVPYVKYDAGNAEFWVWDEVKKEFKPRG